MGLQNTFIFEGKKFVFDQEKQDSSTSGHINLDNDLVSSESVKKFLKKLDEFNKKSEILLEGAKKYNLQKELVEKTKNQPAGCPVIPTDKFIELDIAEGYLGKKTKSNTPKPKKIKNDACERNSWWSARLQKRVIIEECLSTKKIHYIVDEKTYHKSAIYVNTYIASDVFNFKAEEKAVEKLTAHISKEQINKYKLLGFFLEESKRSKVMYVFRRARPTLALRWIPKLGYKLLASLCFHSVAYYSGSWCGALVPTDDVLSHLIMMRADEHRFWKLSSQHSETHPQADF